MKNLGKGKNFFKCAISSLMAVGLCFTAKAPTFAAQSTDLDDKKINAFEYVGFVIGGNEYNVDELMTTGVDLSGVDSNTVVTMKVDLDSLNATLTDAGLKNRVVSNKTYVSYNVSANKNYQFLVNPTNEEATEFEFVEKGNETHKLTLKELGMSTTFGLYLNDKFSSTSGFYYYQMRMAQQTDVEPLFKLNIASNVSAEVKLNYVDANDHSIVYGSSTYVTAETGRYGARTGAYAFEDLPMYPGFELSDTNAEAATFYYGYADQTLNIYVNKLPLDFSELNKTIASVEEFLKTNKVEYTEESMNALKEALANAKAVVEKGDEATQMEIMDADLALNSAFKNLKKADTDKPGNEKPSEVPETGDTTNAAALAMMLVISGAYVAFRMKKNFSK